MSTKSGMDKIHELYDEIVDGQFQGDSSRGLPVFKDTVRKTLVGQSVIANYGTKRTYIVQDLNFEKGPV